MTSATSETERISVRYLNCFTTMVQRQQAPTFPYRGVMRAWNNEIIPHRRTKNPETGLWTGRNVYSSLMYSGAVPAVKQDARYNLQDT